MKELARYRNIILIAGIILASLFFLRNLYFHYSAKLAQAAKEEKDLEDAQVNMQRWEVLHSQLNKLKNNLFKEDTSLVKKFIEEKAKAFNIEMSSLRLSSSDKGGYWEVTAQLQVVCTYRDFAKFVDSLAGKNIEVTSAKLIGSQDRVSVSAEIKGVVAK